MDGIVNLVYSLLLYLKDRSGKMTWELSKDNLVYAES